MRLAFPQASQKSAKTDGLQVPKVEKYSHATGSNRPSFYLEPSYQAADKCSDGVCTHGSQEHGTTVQKGTLQK